MQHVIILVKRLPAILALRLSESRSESRSWISRRSLCAYDLLGIPHLRLHSHEGIESKRELLLLFDTRADHKQVSLLLPSLPFEDQSHR
jgi:hypothetical protein